MINRGFAKLLAVLLTLLFAGCVAPTQGFRTTPLPQEVTFWKPWLLNTARDPYRKLYVEVDAVRGSEPPQAWLDDLADFLRKECDKPDGVQVVRSDLIPPTESASASITSLALKHLNGPPPGSAFIYVFYYNSSLNPSLKTANPHAVIFPYPCAVFVDRNYNEGGFGDVLGGLVLKHEAAHLVGAARDPSHGDGAHCRNKNCIMNPGFEYIPELVAIGLPPTGQSKFCPDCLRDLARWRATPAPANLRLKGAFMARRENGYTVMTLPNTVHLHLGSEASAPAAQMREAVRQAAAGPLRTKEGFILSISTAGDPAAVTLALDQASRDPASPVREAARIFTAKRAAGALPP